MSVTFDIEAGLGFQVFYLDITGSDPDILSSLKSARARIHNDDTAEDVASIEASASGLTAEPSDKTSAAIYTVDVTSYGQTTATTYFRVAHDFVDSGTYLISISLTDTNNLETWSSTALRVGVGNGLPKEY